MNSSEFVVILPENTEMVSRFLKFMSDFCETVVLLAMLILVSSLFWTFLAELPLYDDESLEPELLERSDLATEALIFLLIREKSMQLKSPLLRATRGKLSFSSTVKLSNLLKALLVNLLKPLGDDWESRLDDDALDLLSWYKLSALESLNWST